MGIKRKIISNTFFNEIRTLISWMKYRPMNCFPHGHYFSPIVSKKDIVCFEKMIFEDQLCDTIAGIDLNVNEQLVLLNEFSKYYSELPFTENKLDRNRYYFKNNTYEFTDAIILYSFIRHFHPRRIIEIGSGFSSSVMLDTRDLFCNDLELTFIEPFPNLLYSLLKENDKSKSKIFATKVQNIPINEFNCLEKNDILFIDSTHVSKTGSDVNYEIFKILPALNSGVIIHFHDIFYPFEYPKEWVYEGRNWNEDYLLRAFLSYNNKFEILHFSQYIHNHHATAFKNMPLAYKNPGGNLWIRKK